MPENPHKHRGTSDILGKMKVNVDDHGKISWNRGGEGMSTREFVETYPCLAIKFLCGGGLSTDLGDSLLSAMGGRGKLQEFNRNNLCGEAENLIQQI